MVLLLILLFMKIRVLSKTMLQFLKSNKVGYHIIPCDFISAVVKFKIHSENATHDFLLFKTALCDVNFNQ